MNGECAMKILYFTSTGNCLYVAKRISEKFKECELISISRAVKENNFKFDDDIIMISNKFFLY